MPVVNMKSKSLGADIIVDAIDAELRWCTDHPDSAFSAEYRKGFVNGLIQAKYLIGEIVRKSHRETR